MPDTGNEKDCHPQIFIFDLKKRDLTNLGTGHYLSPGGGRSIFVVTSEHLPDPPVEYLVF